MSWSKGPIRTKRGLRYDATLSSLSHRLAGVCTACFAYVHATVGGGRVSHHHYLKNQPLSVGFFSPIPPSVGAGSGYAAKDAAAPN
jgi:hypothetical protein